MRLIDADRLKIDFGFTWDDIAPTREEMFEIIDRQPSAQPEPKTGRWKSDRLVSTNGGTYGVRRCSVCEAYYQDVVGGWNFCPNCGARMEGEDNE